jgi:hypothetical protein
MGYFKTSYATLQNLARQRRFELVAGFLVLARHASGIAVAGRGPYRLSGAGVNSIHEKVGVSEETARGVVEYLKTEGVIRPVSPEVKKNAPLARWEINQSELDLDLPHALVDRAKVGAADSALRRIRGTPLTSIEGAKNIADTELRLDPLMLLMGIYRHTAMDAFGGIEPNCVFRQWEVKSKIAQPTGVRWGAEPNPDATAAAYPQFMMECLRHGGARKADLPDQHRKRFWNAWKVLVDTGLIYEAVTLIDSDPAGNPNARAIFTVRVNDFHAGSITKTGDPSLLRELESMAGTKLAYYTPPTNDREEPEAMRVVLPNARGAMIGIWRPRFRASNKDTGSWMQKENEAIADVTREIAELQVENRTSADHI